MNNKIIIVIILCVIVVSATATFLLLKPFPPNGLPSDHQFGQQHMFDKAKEVLGLSANATVDDIKTELVCLLIARKRNLCRHSLTII